jgi:hypothetical protein
LNDAVAETDDAFNTAAAGVSPSATIDLDDDGDDDYGRQSTVRLDSMEFIGPIAAMIVLDLVIIVGNAMVIAAVFTHSKLRCTTTNKFVVSLATADMMVGAVVLPFSSANQVRDATRRDATRCDARGCCGCWRRFGYERPRCATWRIVACVRAVIHLKGRVGGARAECSRELYALTDLAIPPPPPHRPPKKHTHSEYEYRQ